MVGVVLRRRHVGHLGVTFLLTGPIVRRDLFFFQTAQKAAQNHQIRPQTTMVLLGTNSVPHKSSSTPSGGQNHSEARIKQTTCTGKSGVFVSPKNRSYKWGYRTYMSLPSEMRRIDSSCFLLLVFENCCIAFLLFRHCFTKQGLQNLKAAPLPPTPVRPESVDLTGAAPQNQHSSFPDQFGPFGGSPRNEEDVQV